jgi:predicted MFS family arabinose efflux permease
MQLYVGQAAGRTGRWAAWGVLVAVSIARFAFGYQLQTVASLRPELVAAFRLDYAGIGSLVGAYMLPGIVAALLLGFMAQRFGERTVLGGGLLLMTVGSLAAALAGGPGGIAAARAVAGIGAVSLTVLQSKVVADRFAGRGFLLALGIMLGSFPIGIGVGQILHRDIAHAFGWPAAFLAGAVPAGLATVVLLVSWRTGDYAPPRSMSWPSRDECLQSAIAGLVWTFYTCGFITFLTYTPALLAEHGQPPWVTDVVMNAATWGNLPAILFGSAVAERFGANRVFHVGMLVAVLSVAAMPLLDWPLLLGAVYGTVAAMHGTVIVGTGTLSARPQHRAVGMALFYTVYYIGSTVFPALCGRAADLVGHPSGAFLSGAAISAFAFPAWWLHRWRAARVGHAT